MKSPWRITGQWLLLTAILCASVLSGCRPWGPAAPHYRLTAGVTGNQVIGEVTIDFRNDSGRSLVQVPLYYGAAVSGHGRVVAVRRGRRQLSWRQEGGLIWVDLRCPLPPGGRATLDVEFDTAAVSDAAPGEPVLTDLHTGFIGWYPRLTDLRAPGPAVDPRWPPWTPAADHTYRIDVPEPQRFEYQWHGQSRLVDADTRRLSGDRSRLRELVLTRGPLTGLSHEILGPALAIDPAFSRLSDTYTRHGHPLAAALGFFSERFGVFPTNWPVVNVLALGEEPWYGNCCIAVPVPQAGKEAAVAEALLVRGLAWQWWVEAAGCDPAAEPFLALGLVEYATHLYLEKEDPDRARAQVEAANRAVDAARAAGRLPACRETARLADDDPEAWALLTRDMPLVFWHEVERRLGRDGLYQLLQALYEEHLLGRMTLDDLLGQLDDTAAGPWAWGFVGVTGTLPQDVAQGRLSFMEAGRFHLTVPAPAG